jgi:hypothetical protein
MHTRAGRWLALIGVCGGLALGVGGLHRWSESLAGPAGDLVRYSLARDLSVYAYFYTDVGDPAEFLGAEGRYGGLATDTTTGSEAVGPESGRPAATPASARSRIGGRTGP